MSNPKVRVLKDGKWATNPPFDDHLVLVEGEVRDDIEEKHVVGLEKYGYVKILKPNAKEPTSPPTPATGIRSKLEAIAATADNKNDAKDLLEDWGKKNLNFEVDKRIKMEIIIDTLVAEWETQNT